MPIFVNLCTHENHKTKARYNIFNLTNADLNENGTGFYFKSIENAISSYDIWGVFVIHHSGWLNIWQGFEMRAISSLQIIFLQVSCFSFHYYASSDYWAVFKNWFDFSNLCFFPQYFRSVFYFSKNYWHFNIFLQWYNGKLSPQHNSGHHQGGRENIWRRKMASWVRLSNNSLLICTEQATKLETQPRGRHSPEVE